MWELSHLLKVSCTTLWIILIIRESWRMILLILINIIYQCWRSHVRLISIIELGLESFNALLRQGRSPWIEYISVRKLLGVTGNSLTQNSQSVQKTWIIVIAPLSGNVASVSYLRLPQFFRNWRCHLWAIWGVLKFMLFFLFRFSCFLLLLLGFVIEHFLLCWLSYLSSYNAS
jgi:hypothetical protein